jgi:hypothetical protein
MGSFNSTQCQINYRFLCAAFGGVLKSDDIYNRCGTAEICTNTFGDQVSTHAANALHLYGVATFKDWHLTPA